MAGINQVLAGFGRRPWAAAVALVALGLGIWGSYVLISDSRAEAEMLRLDADSVPAHPELVAYAEKMARPVYAQNCAGCHGANMEGNQKTGAANLHDSIWVHGYGKPSDIEQLILYGIRSGLGKSWNITEMPAMGRLGRIYPYEAKDMTAYLLSFSTTGQDPAAVARGQQLYQTKGDCFDCHAADAKGVPDFGTPNLTDKEWMYGGDFQSVYDSIYNGRHGICPAWVDKLGYAKVRALAIYLYSVSHASERAGPTPPGS